MSTPEIQLQTMFVLDGQGRITSTREPCPSRGPVFFLVRSLTACAWAVRADVPRAVATELEALARHEPPATNLHAPPVHAGQYTALVAAAYQARSPIRESSGPAFRFPDSIAAPAQIELVEDEKLLERNFRGWVPGEIAAGRSPVLALMQEGYPVSICFSARRSVVAAEAGVDTADAYRGRGFGARVVAAWALAIRASGRIPLYSTSWSNAASLALAHKLRLVPYASDWSLFD